MFIIFTTAIAPILALNKNISAGLVLIAGIIAVLVTAIEANDDTDANDKKSTLPGAWHDKNDPNIGNIPTSNEVVSNTSITFNDIGRVWNLVKSGIGMAEMMEKWVGKGKALVEEVDVEGTENGDAEGEFKSYKEVGRSLGTLSASAIMFFIFYALAVVFSLSKTVMIISSGFRFKFTVIDAFISTFVIFGLDLASHRAFVPVKLLWVSAPSTVDATPSLQIVASHTTTRSGNRIPALDHIVEKYLTDFKTFDRRVTDLADQEESLRDRAEIVEDKIKEYHGRESKFRREADAWDRELLAHERRVDAEIVKITREIKRKEELLKLNTDRMQARKDPRSTRSTGPPGSRVTGRPPASAVIDNNISSPAVNHSNNDCPIQASGTGRRIESPATSRRRNRYAAPTKETEEEDHQDFFLSSPNVHIAPTTPPTIAVSTPPATPSSDPSALQPSPPQTQIIPTTPISPSPTPRNTAAAMIEDSVAQEIAIAALRQEYDGILAVENDRIRIEFADLYAKETAIWQESMEAEYGVRFQAEASAYTAKVAEDAATLATQMAKEKEDLNAQAVAAEAEVVKFKQQLNLVSALVVDYHTDLQSSRAELVSVKAGHAAVIQAQEQASWGKILEGVEEGRQVAEKELAAAYARVSQLEGNVASAVAELQTVTVKLTDLETQLAWTSGEAEAGKAKVVEVEAKMAWTADELREGQRDSAEGSKGQQ